MTKQDLHEKLRAVATPARAAANQRFFKTGPGEYGEGDRFLGVSVPELRHAARTFEHLPLAQAREVLKSPWHEERLLALLILVRQYERGDAKTRARIYDLYLRSTSFVNSWDLVDSSAAQIVGAHLQDRPRAPLRRLARSRSLWERRIAIISTFHYIKRGEFNETLRIAELLIADPHDLIHKAVGWMLREIGDRDRATQEAFLSAHAVVMPRTMLRYAVEKFPRVLRQHYMGMRAEATR